MKPITAILSLILALMLAFCAFFYVGSTLQASATCISANAAEYPEAFESIRSIIERDAAPQRFSTDPLDDAANYTLVDVTVSLRNRGLFDAEWLNIQLTGVTGDIAVYSLTGDGSDVAARSAGQVNLKLITRAGQQATRSLSIQYYVYGISRTINIPIQ